MSSFTKQLIDFGNKSTGRDKLCRLLQYSFRCLSDLLDRLGNEKYLPYVARFKKLDSSISTARKLLRLGKSIEMLYSAKQALYIKDIIVQACVTLSRIASACFLFLDHIIWLQRAKAININIKPISRLSNQFWLLSTILNLFRNIYDWNRIYENQSIKAANIRGSPTHIPETLPIVLDSVKNSLDILIPLHGLDYMYVPGVIQGATGAVSSLIGIATVWNDRLKLVNA